MASSKIHGFVSFVRAQRVGGGAVISVLEERSCYQFL